jgi:tetratricopeptide (TPR) repeat protein
VPELERSTRDACEGAEGDAIVRSNPDSAAQLYRAIAARWAATGDTADLGYANMLGDIALALHMARRDRESVRVMMHVADLQNSGFSPDASDRAVLMYNVSAAYATLGEYAAARAWLAKRVPLVPSVDSAPQQAGFVAYAYGSTLYRLGELDSAEYWLTRAITRAELLSPRWGLNMHYMLARIALARGQAADARKHVAGADSVFPKASRSVDSPAGRTAFRIATMDDRDLRAGGAGMIGRMIDSLGFTPASTGQWFIDPLLEGAARLIALGAYDTAARYAEQAARIAAVDSVTNRQSAIVGRANVLQARAALGRGDSVRARALLASALPALAYGLGARNPETLVATALRDSIRR